MDVPGNPSYVLQYKAFGGSYDAPAGLYPLMIEATKADGHTSSTILEPSQQIELKFEDIYLVPGFDVPPGGTTGDGILDAPWEPVPPELANPQSGGSFNNLLRLKDLYDPLVFPTSGFKWKDILFNKDTLIGTYNMNTTTYNIEPEAIFTSLT